MKHRHLSLILILTAIFVLLLAFSASAASQGFRVTVRGENGETVFIYPEEKALYLPSSVDLSAVLIDWDGADFTFVCGAVSGSVKAGEPVDIASLPLTEDAYGYPCRKISFLQGGKTAVYTVYHDDSLPSFFIESSKGLDYINASKENRDKKAKFLILDETGETEYSDYAAGTTAEIKGRGNATWGYAKKGYQVKLNSKAKLFGMDKAKTWILIPNYCDQSQMHNALAFHLGDTLDLPYNIDYRYVNLYIDGSYRGTYVLCEKVQIGSGRIDIVELEKENENANPTVDFDALPVQRGGAIPGTIVTSYSYATGFTAPADITGGYLVELDNIWGTSEPCHFTTANGSTYVLKSPEYASKAEVEYIAMLIADMEEAICSLDGYNSLGKHYSDYIDVDSFAGVYAVEEMMKNWDAYNSSMFFYKDADQNGETAKIFAGPLWDFDNVLGNINFEQYASDPTFLWAQDGKFQSYPRILGKKLMAHKDFAAVVAEKIDALCLELRDALDAGGFLEATYETIHDSVLMDRARWDIPNPSRWVLSSSGYKNGTKFVHFVDFGAPFDDEPTTAMGYLRWFLAKRAEALLQSIGSGELPDEPTEMTEETTTVETTSAEMTSVEATTPDSTETTVESTDAHVEKEPSSLRWGIIAIPLVIIVILAAFFLLKKKKG